MQFTEFSRRQAIISGSLIDMNLLFLSLRLILDM